MRIATWNVNSVRQRMDSLQAWLKERQPDIVCLQEIKCTDDAFPREPIEALGYNVAVHGQKTWNGVALLSKLPFDEVAPGLIGDDGDVQARFLEALVSTKTGVLRVVSLYLPNGNGGEEKYAYKLKWMDRLITFSHERLAREEPFVLAGDYNVIPTPADARRPEAWVNDACSCGRRARSSARSPISGSPMRSGRSAMPPTSTRSGTIRPAPSRRTTASASTT